MTQVLAGPLPESVRANLGLDTLAAICYGVFHAAVVTFLQVVLRRMGASADLLSFYITSTYFGSVLTPLSLLAIRRFPSMRFALWCWIMARGLFLLTFLTTEPTGLLVITTIFWIVEGLPAPIYTQIMQRIYLTEYRGRAMSVVRSGMVLTILIATPVAGMMLDWVGYRVLFPMVAVMGIASALIFCRVNLGADPLTLPDARSFGRVFDILRQDRRFTILMISLALYGLGGMMAAPFYPIVQVNRLGLSYSEIGYLGLAQSFTWLVGLLLWGRIVDRRGPLWTMQITMGMNAFVPLSYVWSTNGWMLLPAFLVQGIVMAGFDLGLNNTSIRLAQKNQVLEYAALQTMVIGLRGMVAPLFGAWLYRQGINEAIIFVMGGSFILISWLVIRLVKSTKGVEHENKDGDVARAA